ncbi:unnamed protein product [Rotaria magnacalcarata]|uniref:RBR-type E3 ubiquitin transferase n=6 Tax=Rotaria magnacalcarata TaxID=392030 RepID=A0A816VN70_9BILA|nr:unnamed protein product [Rotaria magnacalcarata]CAF3811986.1 unnamed protein product [Rotaria magnacalcarata]
MSSDESDDDENFYDMTEISSTSSKPPKINELENKTNEPVSPAVDELDENFYEIYEDQHETIQPYIDEPLTPSDQKKPNFHYSVLTENQYIELIMNYVDEIKDILQLPSTIVKLLLHYFKWNKQRLLERFYEMDHDEFYRQSKVVNPFTEKRCASESTGICLICCSDGQTEMFSLKCKHTFCNDCWKGYLINKIINEGLAQTIACPDLQCEILVDDETITKFLDDNEFVKHIYTKIILNSYVENNPRARWCPGKKCGCIINATSLTSAYNYAQLITCDHCQTSFCFQCAQSWHDPIKCILLLQWNKKMLDDSETVIWLKANTKSCPKCKVNIEKNGGCNHMTCGHCCHEFCWLCFGKWSTHSECNRFDENQITDALQNEYALALSRYVHYYDRFYNHQYSFDLETKLFENIRLKLIHNEQQLSKNDTQTIEKAFSVLLSCRQTLIYTYPFAYYLVKNNQSIVFEENQADIEKTCGELSRFLEQELTKELVLNSIKRILIEKYQYCDSRKDVLLKHVKEGYTNDYWQYHEEAIINSNKKV